MTAKKYYVSEEIEIQNGDTVIARPLPIKKLKVLQAVFEEYGEDMRRAALMMKDIMDKTKEMEESDEDPEPYYEEAKKKAKDANLMTWEDCLLQGALIALSTWDVKNERKISVEIDLDYCENNLDEPTARRICEVAGNFKLGDLANADEAEGKPVAD